MQKWANPMRLDEKPLKFNSFCYFPYINYFSIIQEIVTDGSDLRSDEELMLDFQQNERISSFEKLVAKYKNILTNYAYRFTGDYDLAEDIVQETFIRVYKNRLNFDNAFHFSTWIYTIAGNLAKSELKKKSKKRFIPFSFFGDGKKRPDFPDKSKNAEKKIDNEIVEEMIQKALLQIPEHYREAVILRDIQELSYDEIAILLNVNTGTVKSRINRGRALLQELLKNIHKEEHYGDN